ncbi:MAG: ARPP-1 family domain-containing protein [Hyphomicrobiales bacterium]
MEQTLKAYLDSLAVGPVQSHLNLTVFPLLSDKASTLDYLTLDDALSLKLITVTEVSEGGSVPELSVLNTSATMVLILDGEELVGAKQNRIVNTTILIAAGAKTKIPVSCVEQGRWTYDSPVFRSEGRVMSSKMRGSKAEQVKFSLKASGRFASDQGAIWEDISDLAHTRCAVSPSMAMSAIYKKERSRLEDYSSKFGAVEAQVGAVFVIDGRIAGMDCFGKQETFGKVFQKLIESYALDAVDTAGNGRMADPGTASAVGSFVKGCAGCRVESRPSVGLGTDCRLESPDATGFALVHKGQLLHMSVFGKKSGNGVGQPFARLLRASRRERRLL